MDTLVYNTTLDPHEEMRTYGGINYNPEGRKVGKTARLQTSAALCTKNYVLGLV
jgi:hypothetical protein